MKIIKKPISILLCICLLLSPTIVSRGNLYATESENIKIVFDSNGLTSLNTRVYTFNYPYKTTKTKIKSMAKKKATSEMKTGEKIKSIKIHSYGFGWYYADVYISVPSGNIKIISRGSIIGKQRIPFSNKEFAGWSNRKSGGTNYYAWSVPNIEGDVLTLYAIYSGSEKRLEPSQIVNKAYSESRYTSINSALIAVGLSEYYIRKKSKEPVNNVRITATNGSVYLYSDDYYVGTKLNPIWLQISAEKKKLKKEYGSSVKNYANNYLYSVKEPKSAGKTLVKFATSFLGNRGGKIFWKWYGFKSKVAWCACFVSYCLSKKGYIKKKKGMKGAFVPDIVRFYKNKHKFKPKGYTPKAGDLIFFDWNNNGSADHIGIVRYAKGDYVMTIEGNTQDTVKERLYNIRSRFVLGYGVMH